MGRLAVLSCFLLIFLVSESTCISLFKSRSSLDLRKTRQFRESLLRDLAIVNAADKRDNSKSGTSPPPPPTSKKPANKRDNSESGTSPPPSPPPGKDIWYFMNITKEAFINEHKNNLTSAVRGKISNEMEQEVSYLKMSMEYLARLLSCIALSGDDQKRSADSGNGTLPTDTTNGTLPEVESQINVDEKTLVDLFHSLGIREAGLQNARDYRPPKFLMDCMSSNIIMDVGNSDFDQTQRFLVCARLGMVKTTRKMAMYDKDPLDSFVNKFEEFLKGTVSFVHLYLTWKSKVVKDPLDDMLSRMLSENEMNEFKRILEDYIAASRK
ncbi:uncharacterized protein LOC125668960 [Ostrea edulis]|uniref:uncharacterized protein LOC125668960 n=1 Tax=Ostrea edulis TaxID=37623 RepID=UPI00209554F9|nr:uncharacterized protein LOC125668960 [Ostrea edulis]